MPVELLKLVAAVAMLLAVVRLADGGPRALQRLWRRCAGRVRR